MENTQPDFGPVLQSSSVRHEILRGLFNQLKLKSANVLEVGSWTGESALMWRSLIAQLPKKGKLWCVDTWKSYASKVDLTGGAYVTMNEMLINGKAQDLFIENMRRFGDPSADIEWFKGTLAEAFVCTEMMGGEFDVVYIDASHYYADVVADLKIARYLVKRGGLICGDDLEIQGDRLSLDHTRTQLEYDYCQADTGGSYHPGVTLAVWEEFGRVWSHNGVWAMRRLANGKFVTPPG